MSVDIPPSIPAASPLATEAACPGWQMSRFWRWLAIVCVGFFLLWTIKPGQEWDGDAELYIQDALNILHGQTYASTNYIVNPTNAIHPAAYPPGLPMLLAPMIAFFGIAYVPIKVALTCCYIAMLAVVSSMASLFLAEAFILFLIVSLGLNPFVWHFKDTVMSEFPFMLFMYLGLFAFDRLDRAASEGASRPFLWIWAVTCAAAIAMAYEVRAIGMILFAAVAIMSIWRFERLRFFGPATLFLAMALSAIASRIYPADLGTYVSYFGAVSFAELGRIMLSIFHAGARYIVAFEKLIVGRGDWSMLPQTAVVSAIVYAVQFAVAAAVLILSARGIALSAKKRLTVYEVFLVSYVGAILIFPISTEAERYALPALPLLLLYFLYALQNWNPHPRGVLLTGGIIGGALVLLYIPQYAPYTSSEHYVSVDGPDAKELYEQIRKQVPADAVILCSKPSIIGLYGQRHATNPPLNPTPEAFWRFVEQTRTTWLVEMKRMPEYEKMSGTLPNLQDGLEEVFSNHQYVLYRISHEHIHGGN
jgi:hypothetical protein